MRTSSFPGGALRAQTHRARRFGHDWRAAAPRHSAAGLRDLRWAARRDRRCGPSRFATGASPCARKSADPPGTIPLSRRRRGGAWRRARLQAPPAAACTRPGPAHRASGGSRFRGLRAGCGHRVRGRREDPAAFAPCCLSSGGRWRRFKVAILRRRREAGPASRSGARRRPPCRTRLRARFRSCYRLAAVPRHS